ncbi:hypothetical protein IHE45_19G018800 [Dioscorea alata]|uniref:Uncharacterized protein n=1 Tax=Dioscorea alata TaxID=55571 RepID=A0ACB7TWU1_DIOAL|nr:hypothetical protein IHE45_19G018800 [Dioscorea alata]
MGIWRDAFACIWSWHRRRLWCRPWSWLGFWERLRLYRNSKVSFHALNLIAKSSMKSPIKMCVLPSNTFISNHDKMMNFMNC